MEAERELQPWWWGSDQRTLIALRAYLVWGRWSLSSPWRSWSENSEIIIEVGFPLRQRGCMERRGWRKRPLRRHHSLGGRRARERLWGGKKQAYLWPCGCKTVKEKSSVFFFLRFHCHFLVFPFHSHLKMYVLSFPISQSEIVSSPRLHLLSVWPWCPELPFQPCEARSLQNLQKRCPTCFKHDEKSMAIFKTPPDLEYVGGYLCSFRKDIFSFKSTLLPECSFIFFNTGIKLITLDKWLNVSPAGILSN